MSLNESCNYKDKVCISIKIVTYTCNLHVYNIPILGQKKYMCVYCHMSKKSRVGRLGLIFFFLLSAKPEIVVPGSGIRYFIFEISGKM